MRKLRDAPGLRPSRLRMSALLTCFVLLVSTTPIDAREHGIIIWDFGIASCGTWLEARTNRDDSNDIRFDEAAGWISGFLSAYNWYLRPQHGDVVSGTDREGLYAWLDGYCRKNPTTVFFKAVVDLVEHLASR